MVVEYEDVTADTPDKVGNLEDFPVFLLPTPTQHVQQTTTHF